MRCPEIIAGQVSIAFGIATAENKDQLAEALKLSDEGCIGINLRRRNCKQGVQGDHLEARRHPSK